MAGKKNHPFQARFQNEPDIEVEEDVETSQADIVAPAPARPVTPPPASGRPSLQDRTRELTRDVTREVTRELTRETTRRLTPPPGGWQHNAPDARPRPTKQDLRNNNIDVVMTESYKAPLFWTLFLSSIFTVASVYLYKTVVAPRPQARVSQLAAPSVPVSPIPLSSVPAGGGSDVAPVVSQLSVDPNVPLVTVAVEMNAVDAQVLLNNIPVTMEDNRFRASAHPSANFVVRRHGYEDYKVTAPLEAGKVTVIKPQFVKARPKGFVLIDTIPDAKVTFFQNGQKVLETTSPMKKTELPEGEYTVVFDNSFINHHSEERIYVKEWGSVQLRRELKPNQKP